MLAVALGDLVSDVVLVRQVLIVQKVLPALGLIEVTYLSWWTERRRERGGERGEGVTLPFLFVFLYLSNDTAGYHGNQVIFFRMRRCSTPLSAVLN